MVEKEEKYIPIVRWVGSKKRILNKILENVPEEFEDYYEPFVGGAIVFLNMPYEKKVYLNDCNKDVMNLYKRIKELNEELRALKNKSPDMSRISGPDHIQRYRT